jgi:hypothetical protein
MEPEFLLPYSYCDPYPELDQSRPYHPILFLWDLFYYYSLDYVLVFIVVSYLLAFPQIYYLLSWIWGTHGKVNGF